MTTVFIGGSRRAPRIPTEVVARIDRMVSQGFGILVGDANGADKAVQKHLVGRGYEHVQIFCSGNSCRNNEGHWPLRSVQVPAGARGFAFYTAKDRVMAAEANYGLMIWDGESVGTLVNVARLTQSGKTTVLYNVPSRTFHDLRTSADWTDFATTLPAALRERVELEAKPLDTTIGALEAPRRPSLFPALGAPAVPGIGAASGHAPDARAK